jgi:signal transduction histidine kinase/ligand-binding sensor domain-containing protein
MCVLAITGGAAHAQRLPFTNLRVSNGLPSNYISCFAQDVQGRLWIGTSDGLGVFDGIDCEHPAWSISAGIRYVYDIQREADSAMWIVADGRLLRYGYEDSTAVHMTFWDTAATYFLSSVVSIPGRGVWAGGSNGLVRLEDNRLRPVDLSLTVGSVSRLRCDTSGTIWILADNGLYAYDPASRIFSVADTTVGDFRSSYSLLVAPDQDVYACSHDSSILQFRHGRLVAQHRLSGACPKDLIRNPSGGWWITSNNGLYSCRDSVLDFDTAVRYTTDNGLPSSSLNCCAVFADQVLCFGTEGNGVVQLEDLSVQVFSAAEITGQAAQDRKGRVWMTGYSGIWEYWREGTAWMRILHRRGPDWPAGYSYHVQATDDDRLFVSFQSMAIAEFDIHHPPGRATQLRLLRIVLPGKGLPVPDPFCFLIDRHHRLWTKIRISDAAVLDLGTPPRLLRMFRNFHPDIRTLYEDGTGAIWLGGYDGRIFVYDDSLLHTPAFRKLVSPPRASVRSFRKDRSGRMWIGTMSGILVQENGSWRRIDTRDGLPNNRVFALAEAANGDMWIGTQAGMASVSRDLSSVKRYPALTDCPVEACGVLPDGVMWTSTPFSISFYDPSQTILDTIAPIVRLRSFTVNGTAVPTFSTLSLSSAENNIRVDVYTVKMRDAQGIQYQYRFAGAMSSWSVPSASRSFLFPALRPGDYQLEIRALNAEHIISASPLILRFNIAPPFWQRWWFFPLVFAIAVFVVLVSYRVHIQRILASERIRSRIAADLHDDIGSGLTRIAMMSDMMLQQAGRETHSALPDTSAHGSLRDTIRRTGAIARELIESMSDVVWSLDPRNETVGQLADRLRVFAYDITDAPEIALEFIITDEARSVRTRSEISRALLLVIKEALTNTVRHAGALHVRIWIDVKSGLLLFTVTDDGRGFDTLHIARRSGLAHMEQRIASCGGALSINSGLASGTTVEGSIPLTGKN